VCTPGSKLPFSVLAQHLDSRDDGRYMKFTSALFTDDTNLFPNCSSQGAVSTGAAASDQAYVTSYYMQFYTDRHCSPGSELEITTFSTQTSNRFRFKVYRGAQHCLDYVDATVRDASFTSAVLNNDINNFKLVCGNNDTLGNGVMVRQHIGGSCTGGFRPPQYWRSAFYAMNKFHLQDFFGAKCVKWGQYFVAMDRKWDTLHYPNCEQYACKSGYCSGGRVQTAYSGATAYKDRETNPTTKAQCLTNCDASVPLQVLGVSSLLTVLRVGALF